MKRMKQEIENRMNRAIQERDNYFTMLAERVKQIQHGEVDLTYGQCQVINGWVLRITSLTETIKTLQYIQK